MTCVMDGQEAFFDGILVLQDLTLCGAGRITSCAGFDIVIVPGAGGITQIGDAAATSHGLTNNDDLFISGQLEVDGKSFFDQPVFVGDGITIFLGVGVEGVIRFSTEQTVDSMLYGTGMSNSEILCQSADRTFNFQHPTQLDPIRFFHSRNQSLIQWGGDAHNTVDVVRRIGSGGHVTNHELPVDLADDAGFDLPDATAGFGTLIVGDGEEYTQWHWTSAGVVTLVNATANVVNTDTDTNFCIFDNGTQVRVRNRLGVAKKVVFDYHYTTP